MTPTTFRALRLWLGLRQDHTAAELGVSGSALCQFEAGRENAIAIHKTARKYDEMAAEFTAMSLTP